MEDPVLDHVLAQLSERDLNRAHASCSRAGDQELVWIIEERLRNRHADWARPDLRPPE